MHSKRLFLLLFCFSSFAFGSEGVRSESLFDQLFGACFRNRPQVLRELLENKEVNEGILNNNESYLLLATACRYCPCAVNDLINAGADVNKTDCFGNEAIFTACGEYGSFEAIQNLVEHGARLNVFDNRLNTPLMLASKFRSLEVIKYLIKQCDDVDINAFNKNKESALLLACNRQLKRKWSNKNNNFDLRIVKLLINCDADINHEDNNGQTPLMLAYKHNNVELVTLLFNSRADENKLNKHDCTPYDFSQNYNDFSESSYSIEESSYEDSGKDIPLKKKKKKGRCSIM